MSFPSSCLYLFVSSYLVSGALARPPQDSYAVTDNLISDQQMPEAACVVPGFATMGSPLWPDPSEWAALNSSLGGRLQALRPWAAVCYTEDPFYDPAKCKIVLSNYTNEHTRESIASALLWANWESCGYDKGCALNYSEPQPVSGKPCHQGSTPPYGIAIRSAQDASDVIKWAKMHNVKLTIKNTGHDYIGRSAGASSLQVFTHHLDNIEYIPKFVPQGSSNPPVPALSFAAGAQLEPIYSVIEKYNVSAVLGDCRTVGAAGGFIQAGGYNILSPAYGLAVEHVLQIEIVTADGVIRTINAVQDPELFWAVRGGGAGSWGIIMSVTVATLAPTAVSVTTLIIAPNPLQDPRALGIGFLELFGKHQNLIVDSGIRSGAWFVDGKSEYGLSFTWPHARASKEALYPLFEELRTLSSNYTVVSNETSDYLTLTDAIIKSVGPSADGDQKYGGSFEVASRFVPQSKLKDPLSIQTVAEAIWKGLEIAIAPLKDHPAGVFENETNLFISGGMPATTRHHVNESGANPGFYEAAWHVIYLRSWTLGTSKETYDLLKKHTYAAVDPLNALGMTASFQNEGSAWEKNWKEAFFGYKYDHLLQIKKKYDPDSFFSTWKGVGSVTSAPAFLCYDQD